jgi:hypothetical protein
MPNIIELKLVIKYAYNIKKKRRVKEGLKIYSYKYIISLVLN